MDPHCYIRMVTEDRANEQKNTKNELAVFDFLMAVQT
jgi:hypothetical protein